MPITDKTRKILWGRSGNRCAICRHELLIDRTEQDDESVVGDECHIISDKPAGPRHDPSFPQDRIDEPDNLLLLCRVHHKMVDDQSETYDVELLRTLKQKHEGWVSSTLSGEPRPVRIRRIKKNIPSHLVRLTSGQEIVDIVYGADSFSFRHDDLQNDAELDIVGSFLQNAQDWGEILPDLEAGERVRTAFQMSQALRELEDAGFFVFGATERQRLEGGIHPPSGFNMAILHVVRATNPMIMKVPIPDHPDTPTTEGKDEGSNRSGSKV